MGFRGDPLIVTEMKVVRTSYFSMRARNLDVKDMAVETSEKEGDTGMLIAKNRRVMDMNNRRETSETDCFIDREQTVQVRPCMAESVLPLTFSVAEYGDRRDGFGRGWNAQSPPERDRGPFYRNHSGDGQRYNSGLIVLLSMSYRAVFVGYGGEASDGNRGWGSTARGSERFNDPGPIGSHSPRRDVAHGREMGGGMQLPRRPPRRGAPQGPSRSASGGVPRDNTTGLGARSRGELGRSLSDADRGCYERVPSWESRGDERFGQRGSVSGRKLSDRRSLGRQSGNRTFEETSHGHEWDTTAATTPNSGGWGRQDLSRQHDNSGRDEKTTKKTSRSFRDTSNNTDTIAVGWGAASMTARRHGARDSVNRSRSSVDRPKGSNVVASVNPWGGSEQYKAPSENPWGATDTNVSSNPWGQTKSETDGDQKTKRASLPKSMSLPVVKETDLDTRPLASEMSLENNTQRTGSTGVPIAAEQSSWHQSLYKREGSTVGQDNPWAQTKQAPPENKENPWAQTKQAPSENRDNPWAQTKQAPSENQENPWAQTKQAPSENRDNPWAQTKQAPPENQENPWAQTKQSPSENQENPWAQTKQAPPENQENPWAQTKQSPSENQENPWAQTKQAPSENRDNPWAQTKQAPSENQENPWAQTKQAPSENRDNPWAQTKQSPSENQENPWAQTKQAPPENQENPWAQTKQAPSENRDNPWAQTNQSPPENQDNPWSQTSSSQTVAASPWHSKLEFPVVSAPMVPTDSSIPESAGEVQNDPQSQVNDQQPWGSSNITALTGSMTGTSSSPNRQPNNPWQQSAEPSIFGSQFGRVSSAPTSLHDPNPLNAPAPQDMAMWNTGDAIWQSDPPTESSNFNSALHVHKPEDEKHISASSEMQSKDSGGVALSSAGRLKPPPGFERIVRRTASMPQSSLHQSSAEELQNSLQRLDIIEDDNDLRPPGI